MTLNPILALAMMLPYTSATPKVGDLAPDFNVKTLDHQAVQLSSLVKTGPVVLVVLRGWPGYQCPFCTKQVGELIMKSKEFSARKATVVMVYPGPERGLEKYASDFVAGKSVPREFRFTTDPGFGLVSSYGLRWDAPNETAYPSTFVIGKDGKVRFAKVSHSHGDRASAASILEALDAIAK